ncbi:MAG: ORF6N domain-containing protein, partial [Bacteroidales bacterium]|nr:ORF6N domain-containing protein [Bacteroidales bacterium]
LPYAFTEQGVAMLSSVLHSPTSVEANIRIMRAFVGMRRFIKVYHLGASLKDLGKKWFAFSILNFPKEEIVGKLE